MDKCVFVLFSFMCSINIVDSFYVEISHNGPVVLGATIFFRAELFNEHGGTPSGTFRFRWRDNGIPQHSSDEDEFEGHETVCVWNTTYPADMYAPGVYEVEVNVDKSAVIYWPLTSQRALFNLTALLNGKMIVQQENITRGLFVSTSQQVDHEIELKDSDLQFLTKNATSILTYWFVDCIYYGQTSDYRFQMNYTVPLTEHNIEALVIASYEPIVTTTLAPTTTPTENITTTITPAPNTTTTTTESTTSVKPTTEAHTASMTHSADVTDMKVMVPFVCLNSSIIPPNPNKTYGYFHKKIQVKAPIHDVKVEGSNWLQHGDILNLDISWRGSPDFVYCAYVISGIYNITGKEDCTTWRKPALNNSLNVQHYFITPGSYSYIILLKNDVSKNVTKVAINVYEVTKQAQLSVIVVPVACSLLAVILIVFGVAYYLQNRNTYTVEVADFNFGQRDNMEYKTFRERLREAFQGNGFVSPEVVKSDDVREPQSSRSGYGRMN